MSNGGKTKHINESRLMQGTIRESTKCCSKTFERTQKSFMSVLEQNKYFQHTKK